MKLLYDTHKVFIYLFFLNPHHCARWKKKPKKLQIFRELLPKPACVWVFTRNCVANICIEIWDKQQVASFSSQRAVLLQQWEAEQSGMMMSPKGPGRQKLNELLLHIKYGFFFFFWPVENVQLIFFPCASFWFWSTDGRSNSGYKGYSALFFKYNF